MPCLLAHSGQSSTNGTAARRRLVTSEHDAHVTVLSLPLHTVEVKRATFIVANEKPRVRAELSGDRAKMTRLGGSQPPICPKLTRACGIAVDCLVFRISARDYHETGQLRGFCTVTLGSSAWERTQRVQQPSTTRVWSQCVGILLSRRQAERQSDAECDYL